MKKNNNSFHSFQFRYVIVCRNVKSVGCLSKIYSIVFSIQRIFPVREYALDRNIIYLPLASAFS